MARKISTNGLALALALLLGTIATAPASPAQHQLPSRPGPLTAVRIVRVDNHTGFNWGDAGIGAGGMAALIAIGAGLALAASARRQRLGRVQMYPLKSQTTQKDDQ